MVGRSDCETRVIDRVSKDNGELTFKRTLRNPW